MCKTFQVKKLAVSFVVALGMAGFANADSIKCDSKDAKVAFAKAQCGISAKGASTLKSKGKFSHTSKGGDVKSVWFEGDKLVCQSGDEDSGSTYDYTDFKTLANNSCSVKYSVMTSDGGEDSSEIKFTLQNTKNGLVAKTAR